MIQMNLTKKIWQTWVWIRVIWYVRYRIGWIVAWRRVSFRCHTFYWWVVRWWRRVTCTPIIKYWWRVYWIMYLWFQYLFHSTNIVWIMDWSDVYWIVCNGLIWVGVIWINVNRFGIFVIPIYNWVGVIPIYRNFAANFFNIETIFALIIFEKRLSLRFSTGFIVSFFIVTCHGKTM